MRPWSEELSKPIPRLHCALRVPFRQGMLRNPLICLVVLLSSSRVPIFEKGTQCNGSRLRRSDPIADNAAQSHS